MKYFGTVRQKLRRKIVIHPPYPNFFDTRNYCNSKGFPYGNLRHCETKNFDENLDTPPPPLIQTFSIPEIIATVKDSPTEIVGTVRQKNFDENLDTPSPPPPLLFSYPNFFDTQNYCNSKGFPYGNCRHCETKNFRRKILLPFSLKCNFKSYITFC